MQMAVLAICGAFTLFMIFVILCAFKKIQLIIAILKTAAVYMGDNPKSLLLPPVFGILTIVFWIVWIICMTFIYTSGTF